jgi:hypothetical protein
MDINQVNTDSDGRVWEPEDFAVESAKVRLLDRQLAFKLRPLLLQGPPYKSSAGATVRANVFLEIRLDKQPIDRTTQDLVRRLN